jgi:hypothetical protein
MKILTIESTAHDSIAMPYELGEEIDGSYYELSKGTISPNDTTGMYESLAAQADEIREVDSLAARTNPRIIRRAGPKKSDFRHLLNDRSLCHDIDTSGTASEHELGDLARLDGHASLTSCLNDMSSWGRTVGEVAAILIEEDN